MVASRRAHNIEYSLVSLPPVSLSHSEPQPPPASPGVPPRPAGRSGPHSYEVSAFSPGSRCTQDLVSALQEWSFCLLQSCGVPVIKAHWPSNQMLWGLFLPMQDHQAGEPDAGLRTLSPLGVPLRYNYFPICGLPTQWLWDLSFLQMCPSYLLIVATSLSLDVEYLLW